MNVLRNPPTIKTILTHAGFWVLYVVLEYLANMYHIPPYRRYRFIITTLLTLPFLLLPTYFLALYAVPRLLLTRRILAFSLSVILVCVFVFVARLKWFEITNHMIHDVFVRMPIQKVFKNLIRDYSFVALATCLYIINDWRKKEHQTVLLTKAKAASDLALLKQQLQPHFLFNTLNNIYSLVLDNERTSELAAESILKLSRLMEFLVYRANDTDVLLADELLLVNDYLDLEKLRYDTNLRLSVHVTNIPKHLRVSPLMILPFIENCFKHGGIGPTGHFEIVLNVNYVDGQLHIHVENSKPNRNKENALIGVGIPNLRERLNLIYPNRHTLQISDTDDRYSVLLVITGL